MFNLFGLLPFNPHSIPLIGGALAIGVWPILYGLSMLALQALSPPPTDPTQAQIFRFMPIVFTFMFASFPAGLVIYWTWSNSLSILQQYVIMRTPGRRDAVRQVASQRLRQRPAAAARVMTPDEEAEWLEAGRLAVRGADRLRARRCRAWSSCRMLSLPEVAFAGRSNVGKSILINALTGRKKLARASTEPGRTRELNFFRVGERLRARRSSRLRLRQGGQDRHRPLDHADARLSARARVSLKRVLLLDRRPPRR